VRGGGAVGGCEIGGVRTCSAVYFFCSLFLYALWNPKLLGARATHMARYIYVPAMALCAHFCACVLLIHASNQPKIWR
jgi:hypothetical protein